MNEKLKEEIFKYTTQDQYIRMLALKFPKTKELSSEVVYQDSLSKKFVKKVLADYGWPTISMVGEQGSHDFWILIQHMDKDPLLQKESLKLMKKAMKEQEASHSDLAYLEDRILIAEGQEQLYGTQFKIEKGKLKMSPTIDISRLNERREKVGLVSIEEQKIQLEKEYKNILY